MEQAGMGMGPIPASGGGPAKPAVAVLHGVVPAGRGSLTGHHPATQQKFRQKSGKSSGR
jgi:hypothetical protein